MDESVLLVSEVAQGPKVSAAQCVIDGVKLACSSPDASAVRHFHREQACCEQICTTLAATLELLRMVTMQGTVSKTNNPRCFI